ncbi:NADPH-dependent 7-cyano-7-deazaguanine reductase QueF [Spongiibacter sp. KMU-158]|uniref:NADPH-dependent 7-cyano-7-deazaguanine reductase n=1 Tax=Spongiibacter pelagi TaxID=2760804 RepID=A0A927C2M8_9GAMM|nr:NADPH-dependent 7-cyano-7-deazaguanine reductase QueF [Spongiibacter pelagi]MBD2859644.1 NADPH-dependent 7-cyano-7-deazaguanine reductase QueF [Spongiibacter pelagi]
MSELPNHGPLGESVEYLDQYAPELLHPIARKAGRDQLGLSGELPFAGVDIWNAWELSWLNAKGKPEVAIGEFRFPADSPNIVESKSFKLYLNSFNQTRMASASALLATLKKDLSAACGAELEIVLHRPGQWPAEFAVAVDEGVCLDDLDIAPSDYQPNANLLNCEQEQAVSEQVYSHLLRSRCPVTGQPDWASIYISYSGSKIDHFGLLAYLISFRRQDDFHEQCVEQIFCDIQRQCAPESLTVYARYLRRGGLDINPWRSSNVNMSAANRRAARQ